MATATSACVVLVLLAALPAQADQPEFCRRSLCDQWVETPKEPNKDFIKNKLDAPVTAGPFCKSLGGKCWKVEKEEECEILEFLLDLHTTIGQPQNFVNI